LGLGRMFGFSLVFGLGMGFAMYAVDRVMK